MIPAIERALGRSPQLPRKIETGVGFAMCSWLENYMNGLHRAVLMSSDNKLIGRAARLKHEAQNAHSSLQDLLQQGYGDGRPALRVIANFVIDQIGVVSSHALNVNIWGEDRAREIERNTAIEVRTALYVLCRIDPEWARKQNELLEKHGY